MKVFVIPLTLLTQISGYYISPQAWIWQLAQRLATGRTVRGSDLGAGKIVRARPDTPWGPSFIPYNVYRVSFVGVNRHVRGVDHPPNLGSKLKKMQSSTSNPFLGLRCLLQGEIYLYIIPRRLRFTFFQIHCYQNILRSVVWYANDVVT